MCWNLWESVIDFESNEHFVWRIYQEMPYGEWYYLVLYILWKSQLEFLKFMIFINGTLFYIAMDMANYKYESNLS